MRPVVVIAGLAVAFTALPAASQDACPAPAHRPLISVLTLGLIGGRAARCAPEAPTPVAAQPRAYPDRPHDRVLYADASLGDTCSYGARADRDAEGRVVYRPTRVCR